MFLRTKFRGHVLARGKRTHTHTHTTSRENEGNPCWFDSKFWPNKEFHFILFHFIFGFYTYSVTTTPAQRLSHSEWGVTTWARARFHPRNGWISSKVHFPPIVPRKDEQCAPNAHLLRKKRNERPKKSAGSLCWSSGGSAFERKE
jgi:hypothetical protein